MGVYDLPQYGPIPATNPNNMAVGNYLSGGIQTNMGSNLAPTSTLTNGIQAPGMGNNTAATPLGMNLGTANLLLGGIGTIGDLWMAYQAQKQAKAQFAFQKDMMNANFANQLQSYNTALTDKINSRTAQEGGDTADAQAYIDNNSKTPARTSKGQRLWHR